ncbi:probable serine/threonine-protein kinase MARK-A isoform X2 [Condylostylus longicornis]|uniref:probable serine/threonine-protein kinase MARK-A isoform X2 n=1 Tax=Condylostylus longicornis TaxID=2530218 RepID=UPI00244E1900|nr:probable serine/threonine-protein kinase MARK-A isoform X2 [Condylostylus longicornis]
MHTSTNPFLNDTTPIPSTKTSPISPTKMYPANAYLNEKRSPSPTFVNITSPFDYPTPTKAHLPAINHHPTSLKFAKTRDLISKSNQSSPIPIDQTELIFPDDAYRIEFCMPSNHVICKCPPTSADILFHHQQQQQQQHLQQQQQHIQHQPHHQHHHSSNTTKSRRKTKSKNEISNHQHRWRTKKCPEIPITNCQEIINVENYCAPTNPSQTTSAAAMLHHHSTSMRNHHHPPPPVYDVYSYAYLEPPPPQPPTMQQQQQFKSQKSSSPVSCLPATPSTSYAHQPPPLYDGRGPSTSSGSTSSSTSQHGKTPSRSSIKALLAKSFRSRANGFSNSIIRSRSTSATAGNSAGVTNGVNCNGNGSNPLDKYTYTTRYGTTENLYEEVNEEKIREILSADGIDLQSPGGSPGHTVITPSPPISSKEEQRRVQNNHFRILDELNLSLEALIMPTTPPDISPSEENCNETGNGGLSGSKSVENISSTLKSLDLKSHKNNDVDSGYSVSSGSNITSLFYKENFKFGKKIMASAKRSATLSAKKSNMNQSKCYNEHPGIAMTLISPSSPFKSMKKFFDAGQLQKTTIVDDESGSSGGGIGGVSSNKMKNKFWTIRQ